LAAAVRLSHDGSLLAIASSYTYEEGEKPAAPEDNIFIRTVKDTDVRPKSKVAK
jgi:cell cycle arrest protein BUB3